MNEVVYRIDFDSPDPEEGLVVHRITRRTSVTIGILVPVEAYQKHEVCICLMSEGFDPKPSMDHNSWCTYDAALKGADDD